MLEEALKTGKVALPRYSYVSLFGINSIDELKFAIFENVVTLKKGKIRADISTLDEFVNSNVVQWRKITRFVQSLPFVKSLVGSEATTIFSFLTIRDQIICLDDLERRGHRLDIGDVLGLVSFLREQRNCKVSLILNDEALIDGAKTQFEKYLEKVVDVSLAYEPTASDSVGVALDVSDPVSQRVADLCTALGISNIRVIKRMERVVRAIQPMLIDYDEEVFRQATSSLVLFCWSHDQPGEAPTLEFLTTKKAEVSFGREQSEKLSDKEAAWNALLDAYGYTWTDEFDITLIKGVRSGFLILVRSTSTHVPFIKKRLHRRLKDRFRTRGDSSTTRLPTIKMRFLMQSMRLSRKTMST